MLEPNNAYENVQVNKLALFKTLGYKPHAGQLEVHNSKAPRRVVACGVRFGKSTAAAMEGLAAALQPCKRSVGWVVSGTYELADKVYREIVIIVGEKLKHRLVSIQAHEKKIILRNMAGGYSEIRAKSADNPISLLGEGLDWLIIDEAARLRPNIWQSFLSQRLIDKNGWALMISTPSGKGWFYDMYRRGQGPSPDPQYQSWNYPSRSNPYLDATLIEAERSRLPERVFAQEYEAQFTEGAGAVFRNIRDCATGDWQDPVPDGYYVGGLDLAKVEDFTVLVIMDKQRRQVVYADRFNKLDWGIQRARIKAASERYNDARVTVDTTGVGEPIYDSLRKGGCRVKPYSLTSQSKADIINNLALMTEEKDIILPKADLWPEGIDELEGYEYSLSDAGNVKMSAPSGSHDDAVIATALAAWESRRRPMPVIAVA